MMSNLIVHAPPISALLELLPDALIIYGDSGEEIDFAMRKFQKKIIGLNFWGPLDRMPKLDAWEDRQLIIYLKNADDLIRWFHLLKGKNVLIRLSSDMDLVKGVKLVSSLGFSPDLLHNASEIKGNILEELLDYYLYHRVLRVPIEPFHSILVHWMYSRNFSLWDAAHINPERFVYVDRSGRLAMHYLNLFKGRVAGDIKDLPQMKHHHSFYMEWDDFMKKIPDDHPQCLSCPYFFFCRSFIVYASKSCTDWLEVFKKLNEAFSRIMDQKALWEQITAKKTLETTSRLI